MTNIYKYAVMLTAVFCSAFYSDGRTQTSNEAQEIPQTKQSRRIKNERLIEFLNSMDKDRTARMALIPAGSFFLGAKGSVFEEMPELAINTSVPPVKVYVSSFQIDKYEVTWWEVWKVFQWAYEKGLITVKDHFVWNTEGSPKKLLRLRSHPMILNESKMGFEEGEFSIYCIESRELIHPAHSITWYGALAFANYASDMEDLERCTDFDTWTFDIDSNGYRLPTDAEWGKACKGGKKGRRFYWGNSISKSMANYNNSGDPFEKKEDDKTTPVGYYDGNQSPEGSDMANPYGLYDMIGNVREWCLDNYQPFWFKHIKPGTIDPINTPASSKDKTCRSSSFLTNVEELSSVWRGGTLKWKCFTTLGFRLVRRKPKEN